MNASAEIRTAVASIDRQAPTDRPMSNGLHMGPLVLISLVTLAASLVLTAAVRSIARRWGIVDRPDGRRKLHGQPIPLWGGVAVYGATVLGLLAVRFGPGGASTEFAELSTVLDDRRRLRLLRRRHRRPLRPALAREAGPANRRRAADRPVRLLRRSRGGLRLSHRIGLAGHSADGPVAGRLHQRLESDRRHGRAGLDRGPFDRGHDRA